MSQIDLLGVDERRTTLPPEAIRSRFDVDCTPSPVAAQVVETLTRGWLRPGPDGDAPRVLDLAAGAGSWSRAVRRLLPRAGITALEVREEERSYLERWADEVVIGDAVDLAWQVGCQVLLDPMKEQDVWDAFDKAKCEAERVAASRRLAALDENHSGVQREDKVGTDYDLILGNIPFSLVDERKPWRLNKKTQQWSPGKSRLRAMEVFMQAMRWRMSVARRSKLALYVPAAWWQRGAEVAELARQNPPHMQMNIPLPISHRGRGQQAATDAYAVYVWGHPGAQTGCSWATFDLPILDAADRKWVEMPGSER